MTAAYLAGGPPARRRIRARRRRSGSPRSATTRRSPGMHEAAAAVAGGSIGAMEAILRGDVVHAFHPGGGLHHAMRDRASGFCIYNDPALAIAVARRAGLRVLYVDLDIHHGDGVEAIHARRPGRHDGLDPRVGPVPVPGDGVPRRVRPRGRGRDRGERAARGVHRGGGVARGRRGDRARLAAERSGPTSSSASTAPTATPGIRSPTCG